VVQDFVLGLFGLIVNYFCKYSLTEVGN